MITKIFRVLDFATQMYFLVIEFEEADKELCDLLSISPGFKIVNRISGSYVDSYAGYRFNPNILSDSIEGRSRKYCIDGTSNAFSLLLGEVSDIRRLPFEIDVQKIRNFWINTSRGLFIDKILEVCEEANRSNLRKCIYRAIDWLHIAIYDVEKKEVIYDISSSASLNEILPKYLWIPVIEAMEKEIDKKKICVYMKEMLRPKINV